MRANFTEHCTVSSVSFFIVQMSECHHVARPLVKPEVERCRQHCLGEPRRQTLVEATNTLLPQDFGHAIDHARVPIRPPEYMTAVAETLDTKR